MYVAPESKVLLALSNVAATSNGGTPVEPVDPNDPANWTFMPPCL